MKGNYPMSQAESRNGLARRMAAMHAGQINSREMMRDLSMGKYRGPYIAGVHPSQQAEPLPPASESGTHLLILFSSPQSPSTEPLH